jgi:hypothetical protein
MDTFIAILDAGREWARADAKNFSVLWYIAGMSLGYALGKVTSATGRHVLRRDGPANPCGARDSMAP